MTALQLNKQYVKLWQDIGAIADSKELMGRLARYVSRLVKEKNDSTLMTKEEFMEKIKESEEQIARGEYSVMLPGEDLTAHLKRCGYDI